MTDESILVEADRLIHGNRAAAYGPVWEDFARTTAIFKAMTGHDLSAEDGMWFMVAVKISRQMHQKSRDNLVDAAGYVGCIADSIAHFAG